MEILVELAGTMSDLPRKPTKTGRRVPSSGSPNKPRGTPVDGRRYLLGVFAVMALSAVYQYFNRVPPKAAPQPVALLPAVVAQPLAPGPAAKPAGSDPSWPPPPGTPRERLFGDHPGETIVPASAETAGLPYRRRFCDPWFRLSNLRRLPSEGPEPYVSPKLAVDIEVVTPPAKPAAVRFFLFAATGEPGKPKTGVYQMMPMSSDLYETIRKGRGTATIRLHPMPSATAGPLLENLELFLATFPPDYSIERKIEQPNRRQTWSGSPSFKVSPSLFLGAVPHPHPPRDWTPEETAALTGPPGNFSFMFE